MEKRIMKVGIVGMGVIGTHIAKAIDNGIPGVTLSGVCVRTAPTAGSYPVYSIDELIVAVVANPSKQPLFEVKERLEMIDEATAGMGRMRITSFDGLLIDLVHREQADCIVRGIRAISDYEYELQMALMNRRLEPSIETVFMMPAEKYSYVSSRLVKEVFQLGGVLDGLVPSLVQKRMKEKIRNQQ